MNSRANGTGRVVDGVIQFRKALGWPDCTVAVTIEKKRKTRTLAQLSYYWPVVVPRIGTAWGKRDGRAFTRHEVHETLKALFMDSALVQEGLIRGQIINGLIVGSTTRDLNTLQFIEFVDRIVMWAAEKWDTVIPDPDPRWREHALEEAKLETAA